MTKLTPHRRTIDFLQPNNQDIKEVFTNIPPSERLSALREALNNNY